MIAETHLSVDDLIYPLFVVPGENVRNPVPSMPGVAQLSIDRLVALQHQPDPSLTLRMTAAEGPPERRKSS